MTIDYRSRRFFYSVPDTALLYVNKPIFDFGLIPDNGKLVIGLVWPDSPAANAGLQTGDVILEVNGQTPLGDTDFCSLRLNALAADKAQVTLLVQRKDADKRRLVITNSSYR